MQQFVDAQEMQQLYPDTFSAPKADQLKNIKNGDQVKLCAEAERFWVRVTSISGNQVTGMIDNDLQKQHLHGLKYRDFISFETRHIYEILKAVKPTFH